MTPSHARIVYPCLGDVNSPIPLPRSIVKIMFPTYLTRIPVPISWRSSPAQTVAHMSKLSTHHEAPGLNAALHHPRDCNLRQFCHRPYIVYQPSAAVSSMFCSDIHLLATVDQPLLRRRDALLLLHTLLYLLDLSLAVSKRVPRSEKSHINNADDPCVCVRGPHREERETTGRKRKRAVVPCNRVRCRARFLCPSGCAL
jgi:hypothetical protein